MEFKGRDPVRTKIVTDNNIIEQVNMFNYLWNMISYEKELDIDNKLHNYLKYWMRGTILKTKTGCEDVEWSKLAHIRDRWQDTVVTKLMLIVQKNGEFLNYIRIR